MQRFPGPNGSINIEIQMAPIDPERSVVHQEIDRFAALTHFARDRFLQFSAGRNVPMTLTIILHDGRGTSLLRQENRRTPFSANNGGSPLFLNAQDIAMGLPLALSTAFDNMKMSKGWVSLEDVTFELMFVPKYLRIARGKQPSCVRKSIADPKATKGLAKYPHATDLCGFKAVVYKIAQKPTFRSHWTGQPFWGTTLTTHQLTYGSKKRFVNLARALAESCGLNPDDNWNLGRAGGSTSSLFVRAQPKYQVVIYNEVTRTIVDQSKGRQFDPLKAEESTIVMSSTARHLHLVVSPMEFLGRASGTNYDKYCYNCLGVKHTPHHCSGFQTIQCERCFHILDSEESLKKHQVWQSGKWGCDDGANCPKCGREFYNENCFEMHKCRHKDYPVCADCSRQITTLPHICDNYLCVTCKVDVENGHRCFIQKEVEPAAVTPEEAGENYYAFDFESQLIPREDQGTDHVVNLVVIQRCFSDDPPIIFQNLEEFVDWLDRCKEPMKMFAHNLKGYDGRLLFNYLFDTKKLPVNIMWRGSKIMQMEYGVVTFTDTLLHLTASLAELPKMLGLDERQFKKGFFPYKFNTPENATYVGPIPAREHFDPDMMSPRKKAEFEEWYLEQPGEYDFAKELVEYCISDTKILAKAIEAHMQASMKDFALDPFSCMTSASYAMKMYRTYFMPENSLARLSAMECREIGEAMHGGRTDARCLLKEYTAEELAEGKYACYQDVQSLYPTVQFYDPLPVGHPKKSYWLEDSQPTLQQVKEVFGFVCCDIRPTRYLHHPVLVDLDPVTGRLLADLKPRVKIVLCTPELKLALENGYVITRVYWWYHFESSTELFKDYFRKFVKNKLDASGVPGWANTPEALDEFVQYHHNELGIELNPAEMQKNNAKKSNAKILCNSLWGKFGERTKPSQWTVFNVGEHDDEVLAFENKWFDGKIDVSFRKYNSERSQIGMVYTHAKDLHEEHRTAREKRGKVNIALAAMVTAHARCRLWTELNKLGDRVLYHDTDSIIYTYEPDKYNIPIGKYLGEWEPENPGWKITRFVSTGPKCYSYIKTNDKGDYGQETKIKGVTLNSHNSGLVHFESMKELLVGDLENIETKCTMFNYDRNKGTMITRETLKLLKMTYAKGEIDETTWKVYPFGHELFVGQ